MQNHGITQNSSPPNTKKTEKVIDLKQSSPWNKNQKNLEITENNIVRKEISVSFSKKLDSNDKKKSNVSFDLPEKPNFEKRPDKRFEKRGNKVIIPDSEFDFASANAKFDKSRVQEQNPIESPVFYQKSSFFDNISCQVKDRVSRLE